VHNDNVSLVFVGRLILLFMGFVELICLVFFLFFDFSISLYSIQVIGFVFFLTSFHVVLMHKSNFSFFPSFWSFSDP
jgi:hypothetical protein